MKPGHGILRAWFTRDRPPADGKWEILAQGIRKTMTRQHLHSRFLAVLLASILLTEPGICSEAPAEPIPYGVPNQPWNVRWGNHRARVHADQKGDAVRVHVPWRRRDCDPRQKAIWVIDAKTGNRVRNVVPVNVRREFGDLVFQANEPGEYHVYYTPFAIRGKHFPTTAYDTPATTAEPAWMKRHGLTGDELSLGKWQSLPEARVIAFEARMPFHRMDPMEVIATAAEVKKLLADRRGAYLLFPEDRKYPIRMTDDLPQRWIRRGPASQFKGKAMRNEFYVLQIGLYAARTDIGDVTASFSDLRPTGGGKAIPAPALRCFNTGGTDWLGRAMKKTVAITKGSVQPLWIGVDVPADAAAGTYEGTVTVTPKGQEPSKVALSLDVSAEVLEDRGDSELWRLSRLRWLDSTAGLEDDVTAPYTPLVVDGTTVKCLGREVTFGALGLPEGIRAGKEELLVRPVSFLIETENGTVEFKPERLEVVKQTPAVVVWESSGSSEPFSLRCRAVMEFDGYINFQIALTTKKDIDVNDCRLEVPVKSAFATYMMGMGCKGGYRPEKWHWKWDPEYHQDSVWIGDVAGGLQCKLKGPDYRWPLVNIHYHRRPLVMPKAWHNSGNGGCRVEPSGADTVLLSAYGGPRKIAAGNELRFDFGLLITPVKPLDYKAHWTHRYYHGGVPSVQEVSDQGARIINIHHGNDINPFINYPFLRTDKLADYVKSAHEKNLKVKLYYTIRELSNHVAELWAMRSLGDEIYADGPGGGYAWLCEHLVDGYSPAWHHPFANGTWCASISQTGLSRWHNYYVEGLGWLARNVEIDGLYLDEIGYDREIIKRVRRVLDKHRPGSLLDLHSWNHFNDRAGYANCLDLYLEHMPYLDSLWIGEGRDYNQPPDHWMVEVSGIPFGLFSEMLQGGGNPWRGMLYGMTNRLPWSGSPGPIWKLWDTFGIQEADMLGYWSPDCPVRTDQKDVLSTVYRRRGKSLVCLASWEKTRVNCRLTIDWDSLGLDSSKANLHAPEIPDLQSEKVFLPNDDIPVDPGRGWIFVLDETARKQL